MNRRSFVNRLFLFTGAISAGALWRPKPEFVILPWAREARCVQRIYSQEYLEALHGAGKKLDLDELFKLFYAIKRARDAAGLDGQIVVIPNPLVCRHVITEDSVKFYIQPT